MVIKLTRANLPELSKRNNVITPDYNLDEVKVGIVHFGPSDFFRGHLAVYADDLLNMGHMDNGIVGVSIQNGVERRDLLSSQDYLYAVHENENGIESTRVIGSLQDILIGADDPKKVIDLMAQPTTRLVTMTVTEAGYNYHADKSKDLDFDNENIRESLANAEQPRAVVAYIVEAMDVRRKAGIDPFVVMSCDNMEHNGERLRRAVLAYAFRQDPELKSWIAEKATFLNTMVDRIVPSLDKASIARMADEYDIDDQWPIVTERFKQLVIGCREPNDALPPFNLAGAQIVPDVTPFELAKIRILNGAGHFGPALKMRLDGHRYLDDGLKEAEYLSLTKTFMAESGATLRPLEGFSYPQYIDATLNRLIGSHDQLERLARSGSTKIYQRVLAPIRDALARDLPHQTMMNAVTDWIQYLKRANNDPSATQDQDQVGTLFIADPLAYERGYVDVAKGLNGDVTPMLSLRDIWNGMENDSRFVSSLIETYRFRHGSGHGHGPSI